MKATGLAGTRGRVSLCTRLGERRPRAERSAHSERGMWTRGERGCERPHRFDDGSPGQADLLRIFSLGYLDLGWAQQKIAVEIAGLESPDDHPLFVVPGGLGHDCLVKMRIKGNARLCGLSFQSA